VECEELAQEIFNETMEGQGDEDPDYHRDDMSDRAYETVDGHQWVIYYSYAHQICQRCRTDYGEQFLEDVGNPDPVTYDSLAVTIAYGEMLARVQDHLNTLIDAWEEPEEDAA